MAYSDSFPSQRPSFMFDASNAGRIPPNMTYSRSTTGTFYGKNKHLSSDNLLLQSSDFDTTWSAWGFSGTPTGGQADPSGGTDGFTLVESSGAGERWLQQAVSGSGIPTLTVYAKQNSGNRYLYLTIWNSVSNFEVALFDLAGGAASLYSGGSSSFTGVTATQTASGNGYYKCTLKATGTVNLVYVGVDDSATITGYNSAYGVKSYTGDGTSSLDIAFSSLTTTGASDYQSTTTQIHREYAPTLQTAAINSPRFEYSASDGESMGVLIEGQSTNKATYSEDFTNGVYTSVRSSVDSSVAIAPSGELTADLLREDSTASNTHLIAASTATGLSVGSTQYTVSVFAKAAGRNKFQMFDNNQVTPGTTVFDLSNGTVESGSGAIESCGNGWYRCSITPTCDYSSNSNVYILLDDGSGISYTGNGYSGILLWGYQLETGQTYSSSYIKSNSGSTTTRASDSLSMATADIPGFSEGVGTVVYETGGVASASGVQLAFTLFSASNSYITAGVNAGGSGDTGARVYVIDPAGDQAWFNAGTASVGTGYKLACRYELDNVAASFNGGAVVSDTSGKVPVNVTSLNIGNGYAGNYHLNSNLKRIAIYGEALSDTNLISLTK